ncbi:MAG TPA: hypothetical protein PKX91_01615 [Clostridia bacterium]|nr:hypothetical protein [Clostridia bacterium]
MKKHKGKVVKRTGDKVGLVKTSGKKQVDSVDNTEKKQSMDNVINITEGEQGQIANSGKGKSLLSKKRVKVTLIVVAIVLAVALITTAIVLGVLHANSRNNRDNTGKYTNLVTKDYQYAMNTNDTEGVLLDGSWMLDLSLDEFEINVSSGFKVDENLRVKIVDPAAATENSTAVITFKKDGVIFAKVNVKVVSGAKLIKTIDDLNAIPEGSSDIYLQVDDLDADGKLVNVVNFSGKYYGNHHCIKNLDISETKGLFKNLKNASVYSLSLLELKGNIVSNETSSIGGIADSAEYTVIEKCVVNGSFSVKHENGHASVSVGGLVGSMKGKDKIRETAFIEEIKSCQTNINIDIESVGQVFAGGIAGKLIESTVADGYSFGSIAIRVLKGEELNGIYVGGIGGVLTKQYSDVQFLNVMDLGEKLYSDCKIVVEVNGGGDGIMIYAGGLYGFLKNHRLRNAIYKGEFSVKTGYCNAKVGGIVGEAKNTTVLDMSIRSLKVDTRLIVITSGTVVAGGIIGELSNVTYENVVKTSMPEVTAKTVPATVGEYVGKEITKSN